MKNLKQHFQIWFQDPKAKLSLIIGVLLIIVFLSSQLVGSRLPPSTPEEASLSSDELIPDGYTLVTIDLINQEAIQSLVGGYAIVDLFAPSREGFGKGVLIGKQIKLIRTPENPKQFSALVPENDAGSLLGQAIPLFAVIKNKKASSSTDLVKAKTKSSRIQFLGE